ncbi:uncharacterized protein CIMG_01302 [Coccidioides immitis RS]|uniref:Uncharacterized protein n=7 Tax=Coccidioides TaxID=5500 RepID=A0A0E1RYM6_COCIM|nr:uncharacterized protein CIMG_01302 [Coccidioides immitis RS]XP_003065883.1 hypothetical protein CPC735_051080 [Coccidioides posadasii C735 delta SOWgp]EFW21729.1 conserved hypothetical protein [Coccidioides posadasii str. Silveira]KMM65198.1 hypothetical protein CPAG_01550 [Coccidioides posadasii RMSCC 3488]KMP01244.1 hypothetical protein CIRG_01383 [Coccidioides immitis RMSCC 2394]KMU75474.1 hypothetical protein CISG_05108 [Coccidioides immitis RMSCC 3703]KMU83750.1 hypothetical protein C|eukprot:XP_003065883.1 hypothetical protein CPC735_051080 [Coccidioides posadasii C735 delta SOWgp]
MDPTSHWNENQGNSAAREIPPAYNVPSAPLAPPPDYDTAIGVNLSTESSEHAITNHEPITLTIEGKFIYSSLSRPEPVYSLSHALDGHELNLTGVLLTRIDRNPARLSRPVVKRDVFALRDAPSLHIGPAKYEIDGLRYISGKKGYMSRKITRNGQGWAAGGRGLPSFILRPTSPPDSDTQLYEWRDKNSDHNIGMETRRLWDKEKKVELSPPKIELRVGSNVDKEYLDFLVAVWCMHNWREAKEITKEPLTWEEFKEQAKTTAAKSKHRRWNANLGAVVF